jgi:hypothetical protein
MFFSEAIALIEPKLCINHWKVLYKLCVFLNDPAASEIFTLARHDGLPVWILCLSGATDWVSGYYV